MLGPGITLFVSADQNDGRPGWGRSGWGTDTAAAVKKATAAKMQMAGIAGNCAKTARETTNLSIALIDTLAFCLCYLKSLRGFSNLLPVVYRWLT